MSKKNRSHPHAAPVVPKEMPQTRDEQAAEQLRQDELARSQQPTAPPPPPEQDDLTNAKRDQSVPPDNEPPKAA
jgi:hypothetical protein